jgi:holo-[acyl-carrier protein] synthase
MKTSKEDNVKINGIGIDMEEISRFKNISIDKNKEFYKKIFTNKEMRYCLKKQDPYMHLAARFCAKEAFIKATGGKIRGLKSIEIINDAKGKPFIRYKNFKTDVSLSHTKDNAIAFVIINEKSLK